MGRNDGYRVIKRSALLILAEQNREAARWFSDRVDSVSFRMDFYVFSPECCEEINNN